MLHGKGKGDNGKYARDSIKAAIVVFQFVRALDFFNVDFCHRDVFLSKMRHTLYAFFFFSSLNATYLVRLSAFGVCIDTTHVCVFRVVGRMMRTVIRMLHVHSWCMLLQ